MTPFWLCFNKNVILSTGVTRSAEKGCIGVMTNRYFYLIHTDPKAEGERVELDPESIDLIQILHAA